MRSLVMCTTCRHSAAEKTGPDGLTGGETLIAHMRVVLAERGRGGIGIETQACLWNCTRHCSVFLRDDERFSYFTGGHAPTRAQAEAILDWFELHGATETGEVPFRVWPDAMRGHFISRIPKVAKCGV
jgi:predicted metal-binding protein